MELKRIAVVIDADNTQIGKLDEILREISTYGRIVVKRAYGNWKKDTLKKWEDAVKRLAIKAEQQFDYVSGKNATDMALVIDTIELLYSGIYDAFVIVSSDSDYTPLAIKLHESGVYVMGFGEKKTPESFRNSCDKFVFLENLSEENEQKQEAFELGEQKPALVNDDLAVVHELLKKAWETYQSEDGYTNISAAGSFIKRAKPDFDSRTYGYKKLSDLVAAYADRYDVRERKGKGTTMLMVYKCIDPAELYLQKAKEKPKSLNIEQGEKQQSDSIAGDNKISLERIHELLEMAWKTHRDNQDRVLLSNAGSYLQTAVPGVQWKDYGYKKLADLIRNFSNRYEMMRNENGVWTYRCLQQVKAPGFRVKAPCEKRIEQNDIAKMDAGSANENRADQLKQRLHEAWVCLKQEDGWVSGCEAGSYLKKKYSGFSWSYYGNAKMKTLLEKSPELYALRQNESGNVDYRCLY